MTHMPELTTERLTIRPFRMNDKAAYKTAFEKSAVAPGEDNDTNAWFEWATLNPDALGNLYQPPYGDRAVLLRDTERLIGSVGYVPYLAPFELLRLWGNDGSITPKTAKSSTEMGLFYSFDPDFHGKGYATEALRAMIDYAFDTMRLKRIVATTDFTNAT